MMDHPKKAQVEVELLPVATDIIAEYGDFLEVRNGAVIGVLDEPIAGFRVQQKPCLTCIYRKDSPLDIKKLEDDVADKYGGFTGYRICHHSRDACCHGFWSRNKDKFALGQIAQRLGFVRFVKDDIPSHIVRDRRLP